MPMARIGRTEESWIRASFGLAKMAMAEMALIARKQYKHIHYYYLQFEQVIVYPQKVYPERALFLFLQKARNQFLSLPEMKAAKFYDNNNSKFSIPQKTTKTSTTTTILLIYIYLINILKLFSSFSKT